MKRMLVVLLLIALILAIPSIALAKGRSTLQDTGFYYKVYWMDIYTQAPVAGIQARFKDLSWSPTSKKQYASLYKAYSTISQEDGVSTGYCLNGYLAFESVAYGENYFPVNAWQMQWDGQAPEDNPVIIWAYLYPLENRDAINWDYVWFDW